MDDKEEQYQEDINIKLGGMGVYGTASHKFGSRKRIGVFKRLES